MTGTASTMRIRGQQAVVAMTIAAMIVGVGHKAAAARQKERLPRIGVTACDRYAQLLECYVVVQPRSSKTWYGNYKKDLNKLRRDFVNEGAGSRAMKSLLHSCNFGLKYAGQSSKASVVAKAKRCYKNKGFLRAFKSKKRFAFVSVKAENASCRSGTITVTRKGNVVVTKCRTRTRAGIWEQVWVQWRDEAQPRLNASGHYVKGKKYGGWHEYNPDFRYFKLAKGPYVRGKRHGKWTAGKGSRKKAGHYYRGKKHGKWVEKNQNGTETQHYKKGKLHGWSDMTRTDEEGGEVVMQRCLWRNGKRIKCPVDPTSGGL